MMNQTDLFGPVGATIEPCRRDTAPKAAPVTNAPLAVPCAFRDRSNNPCQRLGKRPVMIDGKQMMCGDRPMLHCDIACFNGSATARIENDEIHWKHRYEPDFDAA